MKILVVVAAGALGACGAEQYDSFVGASGGPCGSEEVCEIGPNTPCEKGELDCVCREVDRECLPGDRCVDPDNALCECVKSCDD